MIKFTLNKTNSKLIFDDWVICHIFYNDQMIRMQALWLTYISWPSTFSVKCDMHIQCVVFGFPTFTSMGTMSLVFCKVKVLNQQIFCKCSCISKYSKIIKLVYLMREKCENQWHRFEKPNVDVHKDIVS